MSHRPIRGQTLAPFLFIAPFFILFCIFGLYPIGYSIYTSFFSVRLMGAGAAGQFVGLGNYLNILTVDPFFLLALGNTGILLVTGSLLQHLIALPLAVLVNSKLVKAKELFKTAYFLPYITSTVSVVIIFGTLFDTNFGVVNWVLSLFSHDPPVRWSSEAFGIKVILSVILNWKFIGWNMVIYLAGLQAVPAELYEAADIDGASTWKKHLAITFPQLLPVFFLGISLSIIGGMQIFDEPYVLTGGYDNMGGAENSGLTAAYYLMFTAFKAYSLGKGSAIAWVLFLVILGLNGLNRLLNNRLKNQYS